MIKKLHILFALLLIAATANAQGLQVGEGMLLKQMPATSVAPFMKFSEPRRFVPRRKAIEVDEDRQMWWGYYQVGSNLTAMGTSTAETYWAAIGILPSESLCQGKSIQAVRFIVKGTKYMQNFRIWLSEGKLPQDADSDYGSQSVDMAQINEESMTEVKLNKPYPVPAGKTLYVGITFDITEVGDDYSSNMPLFVTNDGTNVSKALLIRTSTVRTDWLDPAELEAGYGKLPIQVLLDGDFQHNAIAVNNTFTDVYALVNGTASTPLTLTSHGLGKVSNIDYTVTDANGTSEERHLDIEPFGGMNATTTIQIPLHADAASGRTARSIQITKVNGVPNGVSKTQATASGYFVSISQDSPKKTVVEEFTGTWCGWCPRGITGLDMLNQQMADQVVTIAVHSDDPMEISYGVTAPSYPYAMVNRTTPADPYYGITRKPFGIGSLVADMGSIPTEASVELMEPQMDSKGRVSFQTNVVFHYNDSEAPYALGYVLLADGLTGDSKDWAQRNYFVDYSEEYGADDNLKPWTEGTKYMKQTYNHVAIAAKSTASGMTGSIKAPIVDGEMKTHTTYFNISGNALVHDVEKLSVVALLINKHTGAIVNADVKPVKVADGMAQNYATISAFDMQTAVLDGTVQVPVAVKNMGKNGVKSLDYVVRAGSEESEVKHLELNQPIKGLGVSRYVNFELPADAQTGIVSRSIALRKVNGEDNEATSGISASGKLMTIAAMSPRKTVIEEFTGTWCMWCGRGLAGLNRAHDEYGDDVVLMAIHVNSVNTNDPMQSNALSGLYNGSGVPSAKVNRYRAADPYAGEGTGGWGLGQVIEDEQAQLSEAAINLSTPVLDEEAGIISFSTDVTFQIDRRSAPYLLSYALIADGLTGNDDSWTQVNAYNVYAGAYDDDPYMKAITDMPFYVTDMVYNQVAISGLGMSSGVSGSLKNKVEIGQTQTHSSQFNIKNMPLAKKATKLYVAALLYDKERKRIINADQKEVASSTNIISHSAANGSLREVARFTADGKRVGHPQKGLNIVRMNDGSVRKVFVK